MKIKKIFIIILFIFSFSFSLYGCTIKELKNNSILQNDFNKQLESAVITPFGKYPELVTYTIGKMTGANNSNMPKGDTYEDNAYTRFLRKYLNIQNKNIFEADDDQYDTNISMVIASGKIPDIMVVTNLDDLELLVEKDMIEDLTDSYENCASDIIKDIYNSYDNIFDVVTFDGKLMAIPETNISDGPNLLWLRKDWLDKLNLSEPKTIQEAEFIIEQFIKNDLGGNGETVGLVCDTTLTGEGGYNYEYQVNILFAGFGAYPQQWIKDENGNIVYGSIQPQAKKAIKYLNKLYKKGILDKNFLLRKTNNIIELIVEGKCGSFFGPWWAPNNPLIDAIQNNPDAEWKPYLLQTDSDGSTSYYSQNPSYKYLVVRKGYEHPEIACKIISVLFDKAKTTKVGLEEISNYYRLNVDPTARPIAINVDYNNALSICYDELKLALSDEKKADDLELLEYSYYQSCKKYLDNPKNAKLEDWAAYTSRITACSLIVNGNIKNNKSLFFGKTESMTKRWWKLKRMENEAYLKMIVGEEPISYFDDFVKNWNKYGGKDITKEVRAILKN